MDTLALRAVVSLSLLVLFVFLVVSGTLLFLEIPSDDEPFLFLDKHGWEDVHTYAGYLMALLVSLHLYLNWRAFLSEVKYLLKP